MVDSPPSPEPFDLLGPLPEGTTVLEASAGTGKTFTIANLVARYVADGRARWRSCSSSASAASRPASCASGSASGWSAPATGSPTRPPSPTTTSCCDSSPTPTRRLVDVRRKLLEEALTVFDAATVTTTHGFCQQVMLALGTAGDHDTGAVLVESIGDLVAEVADDLYLRKWGARRRRPAGHVAGRLPRSWRRPRRSTRRPSCCPRPATDGLPGPARPDRRRGARRGRPAQAAPAAHRLRRHADPAARHARRPDDRADRAARGCGRATRWCWSTSSRTPTRCSGRSCARRSTATAPWCSSATRSRRSTASAAPTCTPTSRRARRRRWCARCRPTTAATQALLDGMSAVFGGAALGDERIRVLPVEAAHDGRLVDARRAAAAAGGAARGPAGGAERHGARPARPASSSRATSPTEVVALLSGGTSLQPRDGRRARPRAGPGDIAVLVRRTARPTLVQTHLQAAGVPVVLTGKTSRLRDPGGRRVAAAARGARAAAPHDPGAAGRADLLRRSRRGRARRRAATTARDDLALRLRVWGAVLEERGVAAMFEAVSLDLRLQPRLLGQVGGERLLTDLRHIAQVMHEAALEGQLGLTALLVWLRRRRRGGGRRERPGAQPPAGDRRRRGAGHHGAHQQGPGVPGRAGALRLGQLGSATTRRPRSSTTSATTGCATSAARAAPTGPRTCRQHKQEEIDDELRLTYVALTRAQSHLLVWWAPSYNTPTSPLHRLLLHDEPRPSRRSRSRCPTTRRRWRPSAPGPTAAAAGWASRWCGPRPPAVWSPEGRPAPALSLATFDRPLDTGWRRTSYTALTSAAHEQRLGSEPEIAQKDDETDLEEVPARADAARRRAARRGVAVGRAPRRRGVRHAGALRAGAASTTWRDDGRGGAAVAAQVARCAPELDAGAAGARDCRRRWPRRSGRWPTGCRCATSPAADRLPELDFELPLAGGDDASTGGSCCSRAGAAVAGAGADRAAGDVRRRARRAARRAAARLPHRQHRRRAAGRRRRTRRATSSSTTRPTASAATTSR